MTFIAATNRNIKKNSQTLQMRIGNFIKPLLCCQTMPPQLLASTVITYCHAAISTQRSGIDLKYRASLGRWHHHVLRWLEVCCLASMQANGGTILRRGVVVQVDDQYPISKFTDVQTTCAAFQMKPTWAKLRPDVVLHQLDG